MAEMTGTTTLGLYRSIHKTAPGYDNGPIVDGDRARRDGGPDREGLSPP